MIPRSRASSPHFSRRATDIIFRRHASCHRITQPRYRGPHHAVLIGSVGGASRQRQHACPASLFSIHFPRSLAGKSASLPSRVPPRGHREWLVPDACPSRSRRMASSRCSFQVFFTSDHRDRSVTSQSKIAGVSPELPEIARVGRSPLARSRDSNAPSCQRGQRSPPNGKWRARDDG